MSYINYALINANRQIKKEVQKGIEDKDPAWDLFTFDILNETEKAIKVLVGTKEVVTAPDLDGNVITYDPISLPIWLPKSIISSPVTKGEKLELTDWKAVEINMTFINLLYALIDSKREL